MVWDLASIVVLFNRKIYMKIREITAEDRHNPRILDALNQIVGRAEKEIACVLIEPEHGEDLVIRPDIPQFNQNIVGKTQVPVIKVSSSNNIADTQTFEHIQTIDGMYV